MGPQQSPVMSYNPCSHWGGGAFIMTKRIYNASVLYTNYYFGYNYLRIDGIIDGTHGTTSKSDQWWGVLVGPPSVNYTDLLPSISC